jgi:NADH:ubiquinone oxidoreductase subunit
LSSFSPGGTAKTLGTRFHTWRKGTKVGQDEFGNVYYEGGKDSEGRTRRWVIYNGYAEASMIPPRLARLDAPSCRRGAAERQLHSA